MFELPIDSELPENIIKQIQPYSVLGMFGNHGEITITLNEMFNNFKLPTIDRYKFFKFIRDVVRKNRIGKWDVTFIKHHKDVAHLKPIRNKFPFLKTYEISQMLGIIEDTDEYDNLMEALGLKEHKKEKIPKTAKKQTVKK